jgi:hypothetical protein
MEIVSSPSCEDAGDRGEYHESRTSQHSVLARADVQILLHGVLATLIRRDIVAHGGGIQEDQEVSDNDIDSKDKE